MDTIEHDVARATKMLMVRTALATSIMTAYSTLYLGNTLSPNVLKNALAVGVSGALAEGAIRSVSDVVHLKANGLTSIPMAAGEAGIAAGIYSQLAFPRLFPGVNVPMQELAVVAFGSDMGAQLLTPTVNRLLSGESVYN